MKVKRMIIHQKEEPHQWQAERRCKKVARKLAQIKRREATAKKMSMPVTEKQGGRHQWQATRKDMKNRGRVTIKLAHHTTNRRMIHTITIQKKGKPQGRRELMRRMRK